MTRVCPPDPDATLSRDPKEMFVALHVGHDTAAVSPSTRDGGETGMLTARDDERCRVCRHCVMRVSRQRLNCRL